MHASEIAVLFDYSYAATHIILSAAERVAAEQWSAQPALAGSRSLRDTLVHMLDTEIGWRESLRTGQRSTTPELDPNEFRDAATLSAAWRADEQVMRSWLATLDDDAVNAATYNPERRLWQCLVHVVNHGTQHRSEAAMLLTGYGHSPGDLDFMFYFRGFSDD